MKLKNKIHLYSTSLFIVLIIVMNIATYFTFYSLTINSELERIQSETTNVASGINRSVESIDINDLLRAYVPVNGMIRIVPQDNKNITSITSANEQQLRNLKTSYRSNQYRDMIKFKQKSYAFVSKPIIWVDGSVVALQVVENLDVVQKNLTILQYVLLGVIVVAIVPVIFSIRILSNLIVRPINTMIQTMKDIQISGQFKKLKLEKRSKDELAQMGETFNHMMELLETNYKKQEYFVSSASHELRTPLTIIESYASLLKRKGKERPEIFEESVHAIHSEAIRMAEMTEQLLMLAKNKEDWNIKLEEIQLDVLIKEIVQSFESAYHRKVQLDVPNHITCVTDKNKLKQLLFIFMDNARKYSEEEIVISVQTIETAINIKIADKGMGIPESDKKRVFDWFYRVDQARNRKIGGSGLGLSLAREIAGALNISIELDSTENVGTTVTLLLKKSR